jgi:hypothetical protein
MIMAGDVGGAGELIEILPEAEVTARWRPSIGEETAALLTYLGLQGRDQRILLQEAATILAHCVPPDGADDANTGLVVGYVQSGKTMSFTTVAALAHDNSYRLVVVITGISVALTGQSRDRLRRDLQIGVRAFGPWQHFHNPTADDLSHDKIQDVLSEWHDPTVPREERRTVLVTVMKNHRHLNNLVDVLGRLALAGVPALIIDDEADQAGLNNLIRQGQESTTYQRLRRLRQLIPRHTFLQYTATPQGPLLINLIDVLSPDFAAVLTPGPDYTGGRAFFAEGATLTRDIAPQEIPNPNHPLHEPPDSLLEAMRIFFLGVASGLIRRDARNRSMMVHPSQSTGGHQQYFNWVQAIRAAWMRILDPTVTPHDDPDRIDLLASFRDAYDDLRHTTPDLEEFDELAARLLHAMRRTQLRLINSLPQATRETVWGNSFSWILVGGQALDRGFTVEGLTVTYMPRGVGVGNADTVQQRARFFGYKRPYLGFCRVFLEPVLANAFTRYVTHEEDVRARLIEHSRTGQPLSDLRRAFLLDRRLRPTRASILDIDYVRPVTSGWSYPRSPHELGAAVDENRQLVQRFLAGQQLTNDEGSPDRTDIQRHLVAAGISLQNVYDEFLTRLRIPNLEDNQVFTACLIVLDEYLFDHGDATCSVYQMSSGRARERSLNPHGEILNLFQGEAPVSPRERRGQVYPGDRAIRGDENVTIQIHAVDLRESPERGAPIVARDVPVIALWIDPEIAQDVVIQDQ